MWTALVLAGGRSSRMGLEKTRIELGDRSLLDHVIASLDESVPIIVVGDVRPTLRDVRFVREEPKYAGPVAAIAAALPFIESARFGLLGGDMPYAGELLTRLAHEPLRADVAVFLDENGRRQPLCAVYSTPAVAAALVELAPVADRSLHEMFSLLDVEEHSLAHEEFSLLLDIDTPEELRDFPRK